MVLAIQRDAGSPAHAGIDLLGIAVVRVSRGFPRTRGDRPLAEQDALENQGVPPHTRG